MVCYRLQVYKRHENQQVLGYFYLKVYLLTASDLIGEDFKIII